jgi:hypothetical protein
MSVNSFGEVVEVLRGAPQETQLVHRQAPNPLPDGAVLAQVERIALTANNATYALFGEAMGYWTFFPASAEGRGIVPVWGFARVTASAHPQVQVGTAMYGFWPFAQQVLLKPDTMTQFGFSDSADHRKDLHSFYNMVSYLDQDPFCRGDTSLVPALKPLFSTAWLLEDFYGENGFFDAQTMLLTSASSKTGLSTAYCMQKASRLPGKLIGLTSAANKAFVEQTGLYDQVHAYEDIASLALERACLIDFAGNASVTKALHTHYGDHLKYSGVVGKTHANGGFVEGPLPGPEPQMFFAPDHARDAMKRLGPKGYQETLYAAWSGFYGQAQAWFEREDVDGLAAAAQTFKALIAGTLSGSKAYIVRP